MPPDVLLVAEWVAKVGGACLVVATILGGIVKAIRSIGRSISKYLDEKVLPPINKLTQSVDELAARTHENTASIDGFAREQRDINLRTAADLAHLRGHLGIDS